jgi:hypothetical protein
MTIFFLITVFIIIIIVIVLFERAMQAEELLTCSKGFAVYIFFKDKVRLFFRFSIKKVLE